ncbi:hypothetical protein BB560_001410 [Smittium megazygosporum]|uniref:37S ribosomal protein S35, mitochondrial n=1 Tax=Smittium megazygosporum TaxID=133381 RepID=A0A2T9ZHQ4_9FUNG|nr:hypothetical protein BB560_001413 [Smittium megazygosporum]PVV04091.1 hypothetical protein BB560_001410 [Smittium megazygosporum]
MLRSCWILRSKSISSWAVSLGSRNIHNSKLVLAETDSSGDLLSEAAKVKESEKEQAAQPQVKEASGGSGFENFVIPEELDVKEAALRRANAWLNREGARFKNVVPGSTNYVGGKVPFPLNPYFRPSPPMSDELKDRIYHRYLSDPFRNTPHFLGRVYKISYKRVEAILKLKAIEATMLDKGNALQKKFQKGMENVLGVPDPNKATFYEPFKVSPFKIKNPLFKTINEFEEFTPEDAAKELNKEPFAEIEKASNMNKFYEIDYPGLPEKFAPKRVTKEFISSGEKSGYYAKNRNAPVKTPPKPHVFGKDSRLGNKRWDFVFLDTSKDFESKDKPVIVRKRDGSLVEATESQRKQRIEQRYPNKLHTSS